MLLSQHYCVTVGCCSVDSTKSESERLHRRVSSLGNQHDTELLSVTKELPRNRSSPDFDLVKPSEALSNSASQSRTSSAENSSKESAEVALSTTTNAH